MADPKDRRHPWRGALFGDGHKRPPLMSAKRCMDSVRGAFLSFIRDGFLYVIASDRMVRFTAVWKDPDESPIGYFQACAWDFGFPLFCESTFLVWQSQRRLNNAIDYEPEVDKVVRIPRGRRRK